MVLEVMIDGEWQAVGKEEIYMSKNRDFVDGKYPIKYFTKTEHSTILLAGDFGNMGLFDGVFTKPELKDLFIELKLISSYRFSSAKSMLEGCSNLKKVDMSLFNFEGGIWVENMFKGCANLVCVKLNAASGELNRLKYKSGMFDGCEEIEEIDLSSFVDWEYAGHVENMFRNCHKLKIVYVYNSAAKKFLETNRAITGANPNVQFIVKN